VRETKFIIFTTQSALFIGLVWRDSQIRCDETPHRAHRTTSRRERRVLDVSPLRKFAPLDVFNVSSTFPAYSVKTQACILARWRGAVFRDTLKILQPAPSHAFTGLNRRKTVADTLGNPSTDY